MGIGFEIDPNTTLLVINRTTRLAVCHFKLHRRATALARRRRVPVVNHSVARLDERSHWKFGSNFLIFVLSSLVGRLSRSRLVYLPERAAVPKLKPVMPCSPCPLRKSTARASAGGSSRQRRVALEFGRVAFGIDWCGLPWRHADTRSSRARSIDATYPLQLNSEALLIGNRWRVDAEEFD